jgi:hypothetical protein
MGTVLPSARLAWSTRLCAFVSILEAREVALLESLSGPRLRPGPGSRRTPEEVKES